MTEKIAAHCIAINAIMLAAESITDKAVLDDTPSNEAMDAARAFLGILADDGITAVTVLSFIASGARDHLMYLQARDN